MPDHQVQKDQDPSDSTYNTWYTKFSGDMSVFLSNLAQFDYMCQHTKDPGEILQFAMTVLFPDKMQIGEDEMSEQAYAIQDLSTLTNMVSTLQQDLQSGQFTQYQTDYANLRNYIQGGQMDPWLQPSNGSISGSYTDPKGNTISITIPYNFGGLLGDGSEGSALASLINEVGDPATQTGLGALTNHTTFSQAYYNLTGVYLPDPNWSPNSSNGTTPPNPSEAQQYVNAFSQATSQVSSASSFANNQLQYQQQNYQKMTQTLQDIMSSVMDYIKQINQNISST